MGFIFLYRPQYFIDDIELIIKNMLPNSLGGELNIGNINGNFVTGFKVSDFNYTKDSTIVFSAKEIYIDPDLSRIAFGTIALSELILKSSYYNYEKFPLVASLSKFTKIQSDIRSVEYEILNSLVSKTKDRQLSFDSKSTLLETDKQAYYTNSTVDAKVVVGNTDSSFKPDRVDLRVDNIQLKESEFEVVDGKIKLSKRFSSPGIKKIYGYLFFDNNGNTDSLLVDTQFYVIPKPNEAIVSPVNMQVFYIGLRNEIAVAFPGIADLTSIRVNAKNGTILKSGSRYFAAPNAGVENMDVIVSGKANDEVVTSLLNFRVEDAPPGRGSVYERVGGQDYNFVNSDKISKESLLYGLIRGEKPPGFLYDYDINVESFQVTVGNLPTRTVQGNKIQNSSEAVRDINGANRGSSVTVTVLKAVKIDGDLKSPTNVEPFVVTIE